MPAFSTKGSCNMSRWVIIGGAGFTGSNLTNKLIEQLNINPSNILICDLEKSLDRIKLPVNLYPCNISQNILPKFKKNDIVIHLAARQYHNKVPWKNRLDWFSEVNFLGTKNILNSIINTDIKGLVYFSSDMVYGIPNSTPVKIDHPTNPIGPYGESKLAAENILISAKNNGIPITILRPRMIMGEGRLGVIEKLFKAISLDRPIPLIGKGQNYYQMVSVDDCSNAIILSVENNFPSQILNLGSNPEFKVKDLLKNLIKEISSKSFLIPLPTKLSKFILNFLDLINLTVLYPEQFTIADKNYIVDISSAKNLIGWEPKHTDLEMMIAAYRNWNDKSVI